MPLIGPDGETLLFEDWGPAFTEDDFLAIGSLSLRRVRDDAAACGSADWNCRRKDCLRQRQRRDHGGPFRRRQPDVLPATPYA